MDESNQLLAHFSRSDFDAQMQTDQAFPFFNTLINCTNHTFSYTLCAFVPLMLYC